MDKNPKLHLPTAFSIYAVASAGIALVAYVLRYQHIPTTRDIITGAVGVVVIPLMVLFLGAWITDKKGRGRERAKKILSEGWHFILGWVGAGLAVYAGATLLLGHAFRASPLVCIFAGPFAFLSSPQWGLALLLLIAWTAFIGAIVRSKKLAHHDPDSKGHIRGLFKNFTRAAGHESKEIKRSPEKEPEGAHFVQTIEAVERYVARDGELYPRIPLAQASLAPAYGGLEEEAVWMCLPPEEGSGLVIGGAGTGKSNLLINILLNIEMCRSKDDLPFKIVVTTTKALSLSEPTVPWLRAQGFKVSMWDLSNTTAKYGNKFGDPVRWSPLVSSKTYDTAKRTAQRLVESVHSDYETRDDFWKLQTLAIISPCLLAAALTSGKTYEDALTWASGWSDPSMNEVDRILTLHGADTALAGWQRARKMLLKQTGDLTWEETEGVGSVAATGMSIDATLAGLMLGLSTQTAFTATNDPNFDPQKWIRSDTPEVLFLIGGSIQEEATTKSLLAPMLHVLLSEASDFAAEEGGQLPYHLLVLADELANLAPIPDLAKIYSTMREARLRMVAVFQTLHQADEVYGPRVTQILLASSVSTLYLQTSDPTTINALAAIAGTEHVETKSQSETGDSKSTTTSVMYRPLIDGSVMAALKEPHPKKLTPGEGLLQTRAGIVKVSIPYYSNTEPFASRAVVPAKHQAALEAWKARQSMPLKDKLAARKAEFRALLSARSRDRHPVEDFDRTSPALNHPPIAVANTVIARPPTDVSIANVAIPLAPVPPPTEIARQDSKRPPLVAPPAQSPSKSRKLITNPIQPTLFPLRTDDHSDNGSYRLTKVDAAPSSPSSPSASASAQPAIAAERPVTAPLVCLPAPLVELCGMRKIFWRGVVDEDGVVDEATADMSRRHLAKSFVEDEAHLFWRVLWGTWGGDEEFESTFTPLVDESWVSSDPVAFTTRRAPAPRKGGGMRVRKSASNA